MLRSFLQLIALALFLVVFLTIALLLAAYTGHMGEAAHDWVDWFVQEGLKNRPLIEKVFALIGAVTTLTISALGVYKTWHFAEINLPLRLEQLAERWRREAICYRPKVAPDLTLVESITLTTRYERGPWTRLISFIYDVDQIALSRCTRKIERFEKELLALEGSRSHCLAAIQTGYLERGHIERQCNPQACERVLDLFKKPLERDPRDFDALELCARQAYAMGMRAHALDYLVQLIEATKPTGGVRHARALRFHAEILRIGSLADRALAREQLESGISALSVVEGGAAGVRQSELGLAFAELAEVHLRAGRFRLLKNALADAERYLGSTHRLRDILDRFRRTREGISDPPKPGDSAA